MGLEGALEEALEDATVRPPPYLPPSLIRRGSPRPAAAAAPLLRAVYEGVHDFVSYCGAAAFSGLVPQETPAALALHAMIESAGSHILLAPSAYMRPGVVVAVGGDVGGGAGGGGGGGGGGDGRDEVAFRCAVRSAIRTANLRVMQLMAPAAVYRLRARLPREYVAAYVDAQEHFSGAALVRGLTRGEFVQGGLATRAPPRLVLLTRTSAELGVTADAALLAAALGYPRHVVLACDGSGGGGGGGGDGDADTEGSAAAGGGAGGGSTGRGRRQGKRGNRRRRGGASDAAAAAGDGAAAEADLLFGRCAPGAAAGTLHVIVLRDVPSSTACAALVDVFFARAAAGMGGGGAVDALPPLLLVLCDMAACTFAQVTRARRCVDDALGARAAVWGGGGGGAGGRDGGGAALPIVVLLLHRPAAELLLRPTYDAVSMGWDAVHVDAWDGADVDGADVDAGGGAVERKEAESRGGGGVRAWVRVMYGLAPTLTEADSRVEFAAGVETALWRAVTQCRFGAARFASLPAAARAALAASRAVYDPSTPPAVAPGAVLAALQGRPYIAEALVGVFAEYWSGFLGALGDAGARGSSDERPFLGAIRARHRWLLTDFMAAVVRGALAAEWGLEAIMRLPTGEVASAEDDPGVRVCVAALRALRVGTEGTFTTRAVPCDGPSVPLTPLFVAMISRLEEARRVARALTAVRGMYANSELAAWRSALDRPEWASLRGVVAAVQGSPRVWGAWVRDFVGVHLRFEVSSEREWAVLRVAALGAVGAAPAPCERDDAGAPCDVLALCVARAGVRAAVQEVQAALRPLLAAGSPGDGCAGGGGGDDDAGGGFDDDAIARVTAGWTELRGGGAAVLCGRLRMEALRWAWESARGIRDCGHAAAWVRLVRDLRWAGPLFDGRTAALVCGALEADAGARCGGGALEATWRRRCAVVVALFHVLCQSHVHDCAAYARRALAAGCLHDVPGALPLQSALRVVHAALGAPCGLPEHASTVSRIVRELLMWAVRRAAPDVAVGDVCDPAALAAALLLSAGGDMDGDEGAPWRPVGALPAPTRVEAVAALLARCADDGGGDAEAFAVACEGLLAERVTRGGADDPYLPACVLAVAGGGAGAAMLRLGTDARLVFEPPAAAEVAFAACEVAAAALGGCPRLTRHGTLARIAAAAGDVAALRAAAAAFEGADAPTLARGAAAVLGGAAAAAALAAALARAPGHHGAYLLALLPLDALCRVLAAEPLLTGLGLGHLVVARGPPVRGPGGGGVPARELATLQVTVALLNARAGVSAVAGGTGFGGATACAAHMRGALVSEGGAAAGGGGGGLPPRTCAGLAALLEPRCRAELALGEHIPLLASLVAFTRDALALRLTEPQLGGPLTGALAELPEDAAAAGRAMLGRFLPAWRAMRAAFTTFEQCPRELAAAAAVPEFASAEELLVLYVVEPPSKEGEAASAYVTRMLRDRFVPQQRRVLDPEEASSACGAFGDAEFNRHEWMAPAAPPAPQSLGALPAHGPDARARVLTGGFASDDVDGAAAAREIDSLVRGSLLGVVEAMDAAAGAAAAAAAARVGGEATAARAAALVDAEARRLQQHYAADEWSICPTCRKMWGYAGGCDQMKCGTNAHDRVVQQGCGAAYNRSQNRVPAGGPPLPQFVDMARHAAEGALRGLQTELANIAPLRNTRWVIDARALAASVLPRVLGGRVQFGLAVDPFFRCAVGGGGGGRGCHCWWRFWLRAGAGMHRRDVTVVPCAGRWRCARSYLWAAAARRRARAPRRTSRVTSGRGCASRARRCGRAARACRCRRRLCHLSSCCAR